MASQSYKLKKTVLGNKVVKEKLSTSFNKLAKSDIPLDESKIKSIYDEIFYKIPIEGKDSHKNIVDRTYEYLFENYNNQLESDITKLAEQIMAKTTELDSYDNIINNKEHPLYEDGSLLMHGTAGHPYQDSNYIWIMQEGLKRRFQSDNNPVFIETKKALRIPKEGFDGRYFVGTSDLQSIPNGVPITKTEDLNLTGLQLIPDGEIDDLTVRHAYTTVTITCEGAESDQTLQVQIGTTEGTLDYSQAQFVLDGSCTIKYLKDDYSTDNEPLSIETLVLAKDESIDIDILRDGLGAEDSGIPPDINNLYQEAGAYDVQTIQYNGNDIPGYIKNWGPYDTTGYYGSILYAFGRLKIKQHPNEYLTNTLFVPQDLEETLLNGMPESLITETGTEANITLVDAADDSAYMTPMIYRDTSGEQQLWGNLNQGHWMQENLLSSPSAPYYRQEVSWYHRRRSGSGKVYGQPILRMYEQDTYAVIVGWFVKSSTRWIVFFDLITDKTFELKHKNTKEYDYPVMLKTHGTTGIDGISWDQPGTIQRIVWDGYIGLKGYQTLGQDWDGGQGNRFNQHSNYEWIGNL
tara:strand:+ start:1484 stop:3211 length:1728 start_codon:yes stop_codon:yes gene_type:complete